MSAWALTSLAHFLEFEVAEGDFDVAAIAESLSELLGEIDGTVLAAGATEGDH